MKSEAVLEFISVFLNLGANFFSQIGWKMEICYSFFLCVLLRAFWVGSAWATLWPYPLGGNILVWRPMRTGTAASQTLHRDPDGQPESQPVPLCEQCQTSQFALLLFQIMGTHRKIDGASESMFPKPLVENILQLLWWADSPSPQAPGLASSSLMVLLWWLCPGALLSTFLHRI